MLTIIENLLWLSSFWRAQSSGGLQVEPAPDPQGNKKAANPVGIRGQFGNLFALSNFSLYLDLRAIHPWPLPDHGKRYVKANQE
jgi:hypothetical protein